MAISQSGTPALIEDLRATMAWREDEKAALLADSDLGVEAAARIAEIDAETAELADRLTAIEAEWMTERKLVR